MPANKGMKQTKPAQAVELRSLSLVLGGPSVDRESSHARDMEGGRCNRHRIHLFGDVRLFSAWRRTHCIQLRKGDRRGKSIGGVADRRHARRRPARRHGYAPQCDRHRFVVRGIRCAGEAATTAPSEQRGVPGARANPWISRCRGKRSRRSRWLQACVAHHNGGGHVSGGLHSDGRARQVTSEPPNKGMKLTKLSAAPFRGRSAASCPRRSTSDAGTASQLIPGVRRT